jgi:hypothetical protein
LWWRIDFGEVDDERYQTKQRQRLIDDIDSNDVTGYKSLNLMNLMNIDGLRCYLGR